MIYEPHDWLNHKFFKCTGEGSIISCFFSRNDKQLLCWNYKLGQIRLKLKQNKQATKCKRSQGFLFSLFSILVLKNTRLYLVYIRCLGGSFVFLLFPLVVSCFILKSSFLSRPVQFYLLSVFHRLQFLVLHLHSLATLLDNINI